MGWGGVGYRVGWGGVGWMDGVYYGQPLSAAAIAASPGICCNHTEQSHGCFLLLYMVRLVSLLFACLSICRFVFLSVFFDLFLSVCLCACVRAVGCVMFKSDKCEPVNGAVPFLTHALKVVFVCRHHVISGSRWGGSMRTVDMWEGMGSMNE